MTDPAYGIVPAPTKVHYPAAVDSIVGDSSPWRSARCSSRTAQPTGVLSGTHVHVRSRRDAHVGTHAE
jgi:hypothetical protein